MTGIAAWSYLLRVEGTPMSLTEIIASYKECLRQPFCAIVAGSWAASVAIALDFRVWASGALLLPGLLWLMFYPLIRRSLPDDRPPAGDSFLLWLFWLFVAGSTVALFH